MRNGVNKVKLKLLFWIDNRDVRIARELALLLLLSVKRPHYYLFPSYRNNLSVSVREFDVSAGQKMSSF